jgi:hypothetical protein
MLSDGPAFYDYFYEQNELITAGTIPGTPLRMDSLMIINGIVDEYIQAPYYPEFAMNNTYGVKALPDDVYLATVDAVYRPGGCLDQVQNCSTADRSTAEGAEICANATNFCRGEVEGPYYDYGGRGVYGT